MSAPLPDALRARFQRYVEEGLSGRSAALRLRLSPATGARWAWQVHRTGRIDPVPQSHLKGRGKLDPHRGFFAEIIGQDAAITMPELSSALLDATGERAHPNSIGKFLRKLGYIYKKDIGCHRTPAYTGKAAACRLGAASHARDARSPRTNCIH